MRGLQESLYCVSCQSSLRHTWPFRALPRRVLVSSRPTSPTRIIDFRPGVVQPGGKAQINLESAWAECARRYANNGHTFALVQLFEGIGSRIEAITLIYDSAVEALQGHVTIEARNVALCRIFDADPKGLVAIELM